LKIRRYKVKKILNKLIMISMVDLLFNSYHYSFFSSRFREIHFF